MLNTSEAIVDVLVLGAGWTSQFLVPQLESQGLSYALTTRSGKINKFCEGKYDNSKIIPFAFQPDPDPRSEEEGVQFDSREDYLQYTRIPTARTAIVTFKLEGKGQSKKLVETYHRTHGGSVYTNWIQLGSTGIYKENKIHTFESDFEENARSIAEEELRGLNGTVLALAGLWGDERVPWNWPRKIASTKEKLSGKTSLHLIHGADVARACIALHRKFYPGERYIVTDKHVYDWWDLIDGWAEELEKQAKKDGLQLEYKTWVAELMRETKVGTLPRDKATLGRVLDSSAFWEKMEILPRHILTRTGKDMALFSYGG